MDILDEPGSDSGDLNIELFAGNFEYNAELIAQAYGLDAGFGYGDGN